MNFILFIEDLLVMKRELSTLKHLDSVIQEVQGVVVEVGTMAVTKIKVVAIIIKVEVVGVTDVVVNTTVPVDLATLVAEAVQHRCECTIRVFGFKVLYWSVLMCVLTYHISYVHMVIVIPSLHRINHNSSFITHLCFTVALETCYYLITIRSHLIQQNFYCFL